MSLLLVILFFSSIDTNVSTEPLGELVIIRQLDIHNVTVLATTGEDDYADILDELQTVQAQCYMIGTRLRLKRSVIEVIRGESKLNFAEALEKIIDTWLMKKDYNTKRFGQPTWKAIVEAVAHSGGGNHRGLAMEIAKRHPGKARAVF
jgi:hypothetical protein